MKKLVSLLLSAALLCALMLSMSSCSPGKVNVRMTVKDFGVMDLELDGDAAPITVKNFVKLVKKGHYDGLTFHRILDGFMIQGGDPNGNGTGGTKPIKGEFLENGYYNPIKHERGVISMARRGDSYDSGSCQFFIVHQTSEKNTQSLDTKYAAFGRVTSGIEVVDAIVAGAEYASAYDKTVSGTVSNDIVIESIVILSGADGLSAGWIIVICLLSAAAVAGGITALVLYKKKKKKEEEEKAQMQKSTQKKAKKK